MMGAVDPAIDAFIDRYVRYLYGPGVKWSDYGYPQYHQHKIGVVNHIPVCDTLEQLDAYFTGGSAQGSTHFGVGRPEVGRHQAHGYDFPVAQVSQYLPTTGRQMPWAQGIIARNAACPIPPSPTIAGMTGGEINSAFISIENVARSGADLVTDAQFNSNVFLRTWASEYFDHPITPLTQLWHSEIDQQNRCILPCMNVLTADLEWVPAGDLALGQRLIAFDDVPTILDRKGSRPNAGGRRALRYAEVRQNHRRRAPLMRVTTDRGTVLTCTPDHRWLVRRGAAPYGVIAWVRTDELARLQHHNRFGCRLPRYFDPWTERRDYASGWLAAAFDGEGSLLASNNRAPVLSYSQVTNPMFERTIAVLEESGYPYVVRVRERAEEHHKPCNAVILNGSLHNVLRFLGENRPPRLLDVWGHCRIDGLMMRALQEWDERIVSVEDAGTGEIVNLATSTGTYFAEGFGAHNCYDPGWPGSLEDAMQAAANALRIGDASRLRAAVLIPPQPEPEPPETDYHALYQAELRGQYIAARDNLVPARDLVTRLEIQQQGAAAKLAAEGMPLP